MDIAVERNAYGRQIDKLVTVLDPEPSFRAHRAGQARAVFYSRAGHPARHGGKVRWRAMPAIPCWSSRAAPGATSIPS